MRRVALVSAVLLLAGCGTTGSSVRWYAPATWFSGRPAAAAEAAEKKETAAEQSAVKLAQKFSHETQIALGVAPASRPVTIARESTAHAVGLLDQSAGPLTVAEAEAARSTVRGLLSEDAATRTAAERERAKDNRHVAEISNELAKAQARSDAADKNVRLAFERENALANELRSQRALAWILGGCAVLALIGWVYVRFFLGGIPGAMGTVLAKLETKNAGAAEELRTLLDGAMNRHEQTTIRNAYLKAR